MPATKGSKSKTKSGLLRLICVCITLSAGEFQSRQPENTARRHEIQPSMTRIGLALEDNEARKAFGRADELRASWTEASLREAIEQYDKAALAWSSSSDLANAAQSILKSGDVCFLLNEYPEALKRYQNVEALADQTGDWLMQATAMGRMGRLQSILGNNDLAQQHVTKALELFKQRETDRSTDVANAYGETLSTLGEVSYAKGNFVKAREQFKAALDVFQDNPSGEARAHLFNGYIAGGIGDLEKAVVGISRALSLYQQANDKGGEGLALSALGLWHTSIEEHNRALEFQRGAIEVFRAIGDRHSQAIALTALGQTYQRLKAYPLALDHYQQALQLYENIGSVDGITVTLYKLASVYTLTQRPDQAIPLYERCVQLSRAAKKVRSEAYALNEIATIYANQGQHEIASRQYQKLMKFYESIGDLRGQAMTLNAYGKVLLKAAQSEAALHIFRRALALSDKVGDKEIEISTLYNLARANLASSSLDMALSSIRQSLGMIEDLRSNVASPDFRISYFSEGRKHYELCIEILMRLDRLRPGQGFVAEALLMSEKSRARLLLDLVSESRTSPRHVPSNKLIERERELRGLFRLQAQYRLNLSLRESDSDEIAAVDTQLAQLRAEYQEVQAQVRQQYPRLFAREQLAPLTLQQIQNELGDGETMLLEYALGEERSYLWAVTSDSLQSYELPARKTIEGAARELYRVTITRQGSGEHAVDYQAKVEEADNAYREKATSLREMLLGPVAEHLGNRRLLVVTEGALQHISLDALTVAARETDPPGESETVPGRFLIEQNEVVVLPSISTLIAIRSEPHREHSPGKLVAVIADPVFGGNDERVKSEAVSPGTALAEKIPDQSLTSTAVIQTRNRALARLTYAAEEADAISSVAPWGTALVAKGFDATRETAMGPDIGQYQIVHFATHGFLDSERPELSGIVFGSVDRDGQVKNGLMPLYDIYSLDLSAQVTVLSACQTALGKDIKGEGLVGLTHGFVSAGSKSVVASLWKVDDRATAFLMADFYESMFQKGMSPAAALRSAKLKVMKDERWSAPYYWAGFVLQGEYTNRVVVGRHSWLRFGLVLSGSLILIASVLLMIKKQRRRFPPVRST